MTRTASTVVLISRRQARRAVARSLRDVGVTYAELEAQARTGRFASERARLVWAAIRPRRG